MRFVGFLGHNYGNSTTLGVLRANGQEVSRVIYPSNQAPGSIAKLERQKEAAFMEHTPRAALYSPFCMDPMVLNYGGNETFHGYLAFQERQGDTSRADYTRYWGIGNLRALLMTLGKLLPAWVTEADIFVVTHLPVGAFTPENRKKVAEQLTGTYNYETVVDGVQRALSVNVYVTKVVMEGAGALLAYGLTGQVLQGVIEGGGFTHDLYTARGQQPNLDQCKSLETGVENIGDLMNDKMADATGGHRFSVEETHQILLASVSPITRSDGRRYPMVYLDGRLFEDFEIEHWVRLARVDLAQKIKSFVSTTWRTDQSGGVARSFARVLYVGGAPYHFGQTLSQILPGLKVPENPEFADTVGAAIGAESLGERRETKVKA